MKIGDIYIRNWKSKGYRVIVIGITENSVYFDYHKKSGFTTGNTFQNTKDNFLKNFYKASKLEHALD